MDKFQLKMRYNDTYHDIKDLILKRSDLIGEDRDFFLSPDHSKDMKFEPADFDIAKELLESHIKNKSKIGILIDPDVDGFTSGVIVYKYLHKNGCEPYIYLQKGKEHGLNSFVMEPMKEDKIDLVVITDAGSNDIDAHKELHEHNSDILIIDHHQIESDDWYIQKEVPVINNHRKDNPFQVNPELTGVGMTLRFLEAIEGEYLYEYYYLAALGQIGDSSDIANPEIRNIVVKGMDNIPKQSFIYWVLSEEFQDREYSQRDMAFSINPYINALVRVGTMDEKFFIFQLLCDNYKPDYAEGYRILKRVKNRQKTIIDRMKEDLVNNVNNDGGIAVGYVENPENKTVVGLVANNLVRSLNKPVLLLRDNDEGYLSGSGRGLERVVPSLKDWCEDTNLTEYVGGHDNAFGLGITEDNWEKLLKATKSVKKLEYIYDVDNIHDNINKELVEEYFSINQYIGGNIEDVRVGFSNISIRKKDIISRGSVTLLKKNGVEFIIFNDFSTVADELSQGFGDSVNVDIVGKPNINNWLGRQQYQVIVEDIQRASGDLIHEETILPKQKIDVDLIEF